MSPMRRLAWIVLAVLVVLCVTAAFAGYKAVRYLNQPLPIAGEAQSFEIPKGASLTAISRELAAQGLLSRPQLFSAYARISGKANALRAGEYLLEPGITPLGLLNHFVAGDVQLHSFTIVEGWNFSETIAALAAHPAIEATLDREDWPALLETLGADYAHPEGLFLPETYRMPKGTRDIEVLRQAYGLMQEALASEWAGRQGGLPVKSPYEALVLASIIEKETARVDERARIAGVFVRRLQRGMRLQTDPTVIYGIGDEFDGNLTRRHLQTDTPYNTYTRGGLPPTPIAMPGRAAIRAALQPAAGAEIYFVATGAGDGSHKFSETKEQHDAAVREYLARQRAARNKARVTDEAR